MRQALERTVTPMPLPEQKYKRLKRAFERCETAISPKLLANGKTGAP